MRPAPARAAPSYPSPQTRSWINADGADVKFTVTAKTKVLGTGIGTKMRELTAAGKPTPITAFIGVKDEVLVYYAEGGAAPEASSVRVIQKVAR